MARNHDTSSSTFIFVSFFPLVFVLSLLTALHSKGVKLPTPEIILGVIEEEDFEVDSPEICLRQTDEHLTLLKLFAKTVMTGNTFKKFSTTRLLSGYMSISLEAYVVVTYVNR